MARPKRMTKAFLDHAASVARERGMRVRVKAGDFEIEFEPLADSAATNVPPVAAHGPEEDAKWREALAKWR